ncbi:hypothetical protein QNM97_13640 [Gordonia sp. L191]|uniref:hypothetical protein n=1 Tax=Gordonia sp. L191 TaxID=2982699 RepID=UPI0024C02391|nr:hypothetical protein [Gordonia sp. L191]WHU45093.1 hypothetical protein QNM97_13640 [Gordonia sp. L191]
MPYDKSSDSVIVPRHFTETERIDAARKILADRGILSTRIDLAPALPVDPHRDQQVFYYDEGGNLDEEIE